MRVIDSSKMLYGKKIYLKEKNWKFSKDESKAYRFLARSSRDIPLEDVDSYISFEDMEVPCGSCVQCRLDYAQDWAVRCSYEALLHKHNYFVTLTIDDDHLDYGPEGNPTLKASDMKQFIKSLRNKFRRLGHTGVRYLLCGEYNSDGVRPLNPHYHMILFNCPIPDMTIDFPGPEPGQIVHNINKKTGLPYFWSKFIADLWPKGFITIDDANFNTESYVSRYIMKKQKGQNASVYNEKLGVEPPFLRMSNKPGIGFNMFIYKKQDLIKDPTIILPRPNNGPLVTGLPKFFKHKIFEDHPELRDQFERDAKDNAARMMSIRKANGTTINQQREHSEANSESIASIYQRKF